MTEAPKPKTGAYKAFDWLDDDPDFTRNTLIVLGRELWGENFYEQLCIALLEQTTNKQELAVVKEIRAVMARVE